MTLKQKALKGVKWTGLSSVIRAIIQLIQLIILTHYLSPSDFGLMAIVTVIIGFSTVFVDLGISSAIIHKQNISNVQLSSLYWLNIMSGVIIFLCVYFLAPFVTDFYNEKALLPLIQILSLTFIFSAIGSQFGVLFQKELNFQFIAKVEILAIVASLFTAVFFAVNNYGVYALVYSSLTYIVLLNVIYVYYGIRLYRPSFIYKYKTIKGFVGFGLFQMGDNSINYFNSQLDTILIGKLVGIEALGLYNVAKTLTMRPISIFNPIITKVTFPVMSKIQDDIKNLKNIYLKTINYLLSVNLPIYFILIVMAEPILSVLFGQEWIKATILVQILSVLGIMRTIRNPVGSLLLAKGKANWSFWWNLTMLVFVPSVIYFGSQWGIVGIAAALTIFQTFLLFPSWLIQIRPLCGAEFIEYFLLIFRTVIIAFLACLLGLSINEFLGVQNNYVLSIVLMSVNTSIVTLILYRFFNKDFFETVINFIYKKNG